MITPPMGALWGWVLRDGSFDGAMLARQREALLGYTNLPAACRRCAPRRRCRPPRRRRSRAAIGAGRGRAAGGRRGRARPLDAVSAGAPASRKDRRLLPRAARALPAAARRSCAAIASSPTPTAPGARVASGEVDLTREVLLDRRPVPDPAGRRGASDAARPPRRGRARAGRRGGDGELSRPAGARRTSTTRAGSRRRAGAGCRSCAPTATSARWPCRRERTASCFATGPCRSTRAPRISAIAAARRARALARGRAGPQRGGARDAAVRRASATFGLAAAGLLGLVVGSFLNVSSTGCPRDESIAFPGSRCPLCGAPIARVRQRSRCSRGSCSRGRCRACRAPIALRYPALELGERRPLGLRLPGRAGLGRPR